MLSSFSDWFAAVYNDWLNPLSVFVGLVLAVPVFWTWWDVIFGRSSRERRWYLDVRQRPGGRPAILIVDLLPEKDIRVMVEQFCQKNDVLKHIPREHIVSVNRERRLDALQMPELHRDFRRAAAELLARGADAIHLFYAGPGGVAAMLGAELSNASRVLVYQHDQVLGGYVYMGPLRHF